MKMAKCCDKRDFIKILQKANERYTEEEDLTFDRFVWDK